MPTPPPDQRRVLAVGRHEDVAGAHRARDPDRHRLLAVRGGVGAEPALPVQRDALRIEGAGQHHRAVERRDRLRRRQRIGQRAHERAVLVEVAPPPDLEAGDDGEVRGGVSRHVRHRGVLGRRCAASNPRRRRRTALHHSRASLRKCAVLVEAAPPGLEAGGHGEVRREVGRCRPVLDRKRTVPSSERQRDRDGAAHVLRSRSARAAARKRDASAPVQAR